MIARAAIPATIGTLPRREALAFLSLFFVPGVAQAILLKVVPLEALYLLDSVRAVTLFYVGTDLVAVAGRFSIPYLVRLLQRRFVFTLGTLSLAASSILLAFNQVPTLAAGLVLSTFAFACIEITSQFYLLDHVSRQALKHFEPIRIFAIAGPWTVGPWLGVYLLTSMRRLPPNPVRYLHRFFAQPRMRLAWTLAAARSSWWNMFYVYTPIFAVTSGLDAETGGILASIGTGSGWKERAAFDALDTFYKKYTAYSVMMATRPQTIGYALTDSPGGLAAWMYDYNNGEPERLLTKDEFLDDITLYWMTNSATSPARLYWENGGRGIVVAAAQMTTEIPLPVAITVFPEEFYRAPETWARRAYPKLIYFHGVEKGGHFAAWEQPELFAAELRAAFRPLRTAI